MAPFSKLSALLHKDGSTPSSRRASTVSTSSLNPSEQDLTEPHPSHSHPDVAQAQGIAASPAAAYKQQVVQGEIPRNDGHGHGHGHGHGPPSIQTGGPEGYETFSGGYRNLEDDLETPTLERGPGISVFPPAGNGLQYQAMGTGTGESTPLAAQRGEVIMAPPIPLDITAGGLMSVPQQGTEGRPRSPSIQIVPAGSGLPATPVKNVPIVQTQAQGELHVTTPNETGSILSAKRKSSSASGTRSVRSSVISTTGTGTTAVGTGTGSTTTTTTMETPTKNVNLVPPHSPHTVASIHTPADLIHKVKAKVKNRRGSKSSRRSVMGDQAVDDGDSTVTATTGHTSKRARLKNRLRALSDGSSIHPDHDHDHDHEYDDEDDNDDEDNDLDESDTTEDEDSDADARTTRSSISRMSLPVTGFAVASNKRNLEFHTLFNQIDEGDYLIEDYGCALQKDILVHGRIYVSEHHLSFHSNILGWVTDLVIAFADITAIEKRMTAFVIPNGISITTRQGRQYVFASFIARDATFDVFMNVWRQAHSRSPSVAGDDNELTESPVASSAPGQTGATPGSASDKKAKVPARGPTRCACGDKGEHYPEKAMEAVFPSSPESIYNLMFPSSFIKQFMSENQKLTDIQMSDWQPRQAGSKLLKRHFSYIKPLNGGIGPKQTKCEITDEVDHMDPDKYISVCTTTKTPDVPSGNVFSVKTRTCLVWASAKTTKVTVTTKVEWTGRSFIKGIIEKSAVDGQKTYHHALEDAIKEYIKEHASEFVVEGDDGEPIPDEPVVEAEPGPVVVERPAVTEKPGRRNREHDANAFQAAFDAVVDGISTLLGGILAIVSTVFGILQDIPLSRESLFGLLVVILVLSNVWTYVSMKDAKNVVKLEEKRAKREARMGGGARTAAQSVPLRREEVTAAVKAYFEGHPDGSDIPDPLSDFSEETKDLLRQLTRIEDRIGLARSKLVHQNNPKKPVGSAQSAAPSATKQPVVEEEGSSQVTADVPHPVVTVYEYTDELE